MTTTEIVQRQERYGTASEWSTANTVLLMAEIGIESDTGKGKIGDGATAWSSLEYSILPDMPGELAAKLANAPAKNTQTADFDFALTDAAGLLVVANKATALAGTLKQNSAMASSWPTDSVIRFINRNDGALTITAGSGVTIIGTALTFAKGKGGALVWVAANTWVCVPFSSGSAAPTVSGTTGSPTTGTGKDGRPMYTYDGNGGITFSTAGVIRLVVVSGGRAGSGSTTNSGSGGGVVDILELYVEAGTYTITVGAGGTYLNGSGSVSSFVRKSLSVQAAGATTQNTGDANNSANSVGVLTDISGSSVGYGGAGWSSTNTANYDSQYGGAMQTTTPARANSGGGGNEVGAGNAAAGRVIILA